MISDLHTLMLLRTMYEVFNDRCLLYTAQDHIGIFYCCFREFLVRVRAQVMMRDDSTGINILLIVCLYKVEIHPQNKKKCAHKKWIFQHYVSNPCFLPDLNHYYLTLGCILSALINET